MKKMINCSKETFKRALSERPFFQREEGHQWKGKMVYPRGSADDLAKLSSPRGGSFPHGLFRHTEDGRQIHPTTWLMVLRATMRGKLALPRLAPWKKEEVTLPTGEKVVKRIPPTKEEIGHAIEEQDRIISLLMDRYPSFFAGVLVEEDEPKADAAE